MDLNFEKMNGLIPAIIQDNSTSKVLMLGFMNEEAYRKTVETGKVTFFSRTKNRLWTKGEESGNFLNVVSIKEDCDKDTLLIKVNPAGPVCHTGTDTCWGEENKVLMLGFMNEEAYRKTVETGKVTFFSRTKNRLWTKGEESGNFLNVVSIKEDCDKDTLLIKVNPAGPVCHTGTDTCWGEENKEDIMFLKELQDFIDKRHEEMPAGSYTTSLFESGINKMAQKVGEEAVETVIEACNGTDERLIYEGADLIYHMIVLLTSKGYRIEDLARELKERHSATWKKH